MSGILNGIKKLFKAVVSPISAIVGAIKKIPILKYIVIAAAIWFTAGAAIAYFAPASTGLAAAMATSATSMYTTIATAVTNVGAALGIGSAATGAGGAAAGAGTATSLTATGLESAAAGAAVPVGTGTVLAAAAPAATTGGFVNAVIGAGTKLAGTIEAHPNLAVMAGNALSGMSTAKTNADTARMLSDQQRGVGGYGDMSTNTGNFGADPSALQPGQGMAPQVIAPQTTLAQSPQSGYVASAMPPATVSGQPVSMTPDEARKKGVA